MVTRNCVSEGLCISSDHAGEEPLALPGGLPGRWHGDRLGDAGRRDLVPACGGAAAERCSAFSRCLFFDFRAAEATDREKLPTAFERDVEDAKLLVQVIEYYHQGLLQSPEALDYLQRRGIGSEEAIRTMVLIDPVRNPVCHYRKLKKLLRSRCVIAVGTHITVRPPHKTEQAQFGHSASTLGE